jgi:hypothetical protein
MAEPKATVEGEVEKVINWKTNKGYFLLLKGDSNEYFGWKECKCKEGDKVKLTVTKGNGNFSDKLLITHTEQAGTTLAEIKQRKADADDVVDHSVMQGNKFYMAREELIVKQTCLKVAGEVVGHLVNRSAVIPGSAIADAVIDMADKFFCYVTGQEEPGLDNEPVDEHGEEGA